MQFSTLFHPRAALARATLVATMTGAVFCGPAPVTAQFPQYTPPGQVRSPETKREDQLEKEVADARWRLGGLRVQPRLSLRNLSYVSDVFLGSGEEFNDITASVSLGLQFYLPAGPKSTLVAFALPEYVYWQDLKDRRRWNNSFGIGAFNYFNRLELEVAASTRELQNFASTEVEQLVNTETERLEGKVAVLLTRSLWLEAGGEVQKLRLLSEEEKEDDRVAPFDRLDREETVLRGGLRLVLRGDWAVRIGIEHSDVEFLDPANDLSNSGTAPYFGISRAEGRTEVLFEAAFRSLEAEGSSRFPKFQEVTGNAQIQFLLRPTFDVTASVSRNLLYSVSDDFIYSLNTKAGLTLRKELGKARLEVFFEQGELDYSVAGPTIFARVDDYTDWGGLLDLDLWRRASLKVGFSETEFDSSIPSFDRSVTRLTTSLSLGEASWP